MRRTSSRGFTPYINFGSRRRRQTRSGRSRMTGFTLVELLVVIAIIGMLASIVLASLNSARRKSRDARRLADLRQIQVALSLYFDAQGQQYPAASNKCGSSADADEDNGLRPLVALGLIPQIPRDPNATGVNACYKYASNASTPRTTYHLGASLEESSNAALNDDKDCHSGTPANCPLTGAGSYAQGFNGGSSGGGDTVGCDGTTATLRCYDVVP